MEPRTLPHVSFYGGPERGGGKKKVGEMPIVSLASALLAVVTVAV